MKCPKCGMNVAMIYKCRYCNDVRCGSSTVGGCSSSKSPFGKPQGAGLNRQCYVCGKPRAYEAIK